MNESKIPFVLSVVALLLGSSALCVSVANHGGTAPAPEPTPEPTVLTWDVSPCTVTLDLSTGVCTVSGSGAMPSVPLTGWPWLKEHRLDIRMVKITDKVTFIGEGAFRGCRCMADLDIETLSLTSIGYRAFWDCSALPSLDIPRTMDILLADGAFGYCVTLAYITGLWHTSTSSVNPFPGCPFIS